MNKVDKKKSNTKKKKNTTQINKKRKTKKITTSKKKIVAKVSTRKATKTNSTNDIKVEKNTKTINKPITREIDKKTNNKKNSVTKAINIPKIKNRISDAITKTIPIPKIKLYKEKDEKLSLTKTLSISKLKKDKIEKTKEKIVDKNTELYKDENYIIAENFYKEKKYKEAYNLYLKLLDNYKDNKLLYKRLIITLTKDYTYKSKTKDFNELLDNYINKYKLLANKKEIKSLEYNLESFKKVKLSSKRSNFLIIAFLGIFGVHKFIEKKYLIGLLYLITLGFLGIGVFIDLINDYAEYEDTVQLDILRYVISFGILVVGILNKNLEYFYLIMIAACIFLPFVYSFILKYIPGFIKIIAIIILIFYGFKIEQVVEYVPNNIIGNWTTTNEYTNYKELNIGLEKTTLKFNDRDEETGKNEYDSQNKILKIEINDNKYYRFIINIEENKICSYNESKECIIEFKKS